MNTSVSIVRRQQQKSETLQRIDADLGESKQRAVDRPVELRVPPANKAEEGGRI